ncbi:MAG: hypothetical protein IJL68_03580 [Bacteroidales bacterium]|nr:hypothetical protein [Bacteroidales bacterium]
MKKIFNIFFAIVFLLGAVSCVNPIEPNLRDLAGNQQIAENAKVTLYFGTSAEVATKASMAAEPGEDGIESIHVLVFNKEGILVEAAKASKFVPVVTNGAAGVQPWAVTLTMAGEERRLHFIANLSEDQVPEAGSETAIFEELATTYPNAAYWQRRVLSYGIQAYKYNADKDENDNRYYYVRVNETTGAIEKIYVTNPAADGSYEDAKGLIVNKDDYIDREGCKIVDGTGFYAISEVVEKIPMVRNFARLKVKSSWVDEDDDTKTFSLKRAALVNKPKAGLIAPYDAKQSVTDDETESWSAFNHFAPEFIKLTGGTATEPKPNDAKLKGYTITLPTAGIDDTEPTVFEKPGDDGFIELYTYERGKPTSKPMCILVGGTWDSNWTEGDDLIWYKVELRDVNGAYFPIYRDFTYIVDIQGIESNSYTSAHDAFVGPAVGDISNSVETKTLSQISDDKGLTLWVEYIDKAVLNAEIDANNPYVTLLYTCYREKTGYTTLYFNDLVSFSRQKHEDYPTLDYATALLGTGEDAPAVEIIAEDVTGSNTGYDLPNEDLKWNVARVKLNKISEQTTSTLRSQIHVLASVTAARNKFVDESEGYDKQLYRDVTYTVMPKQNLSFALSSYYTPDAVGETRTLTIKLPTALTPSLFPLTLKIEANNNCLNPVSSLTTETGKSAFGTGNANSFYFLKTIAYSEYYNAITKTYTTDFPCEFKSIIAPGSAAQFALSDKKGYFETVFGPLVPPIFSLSNISDDGKLHVKASKSSVSFGILSNVGEWTVNVPEGVDIISTRATNTSGIGCKTITLSLPGDNMSGTAPKDYGEVTVTLDAKSKALYGFEDQTFTIRQDIPVPVQRENVERSFSLPFSNGALLIDDDHLNGVVSLSYVSGSAITTNNAGYITSSSNNTASFTLTPSSGVTINTVNLGWTDRPGNIIINTTSFNAGQGSNNQSHSWNNINSTSPVRVDISRRGRNNNYYISSITVVYSYTVME